MKKKLLRNILFLDIETASGSPTYKDLSMRMQKQWTIKAKKVARNPDLKEEEIKELYIDKSAIFAEFSKIICISVGYLSQKNDKSILKVKSFSGDDERELLEDFSRLLDKHFDRPDKYYLCGHNVREFDCPVICRRMTILGMSLPKMLRLSRKKPWQVEHILDTLEMWKFGDYKNYITLDLLAAVLGFSSPKDDIDGSMVTSIYWEDNDLERIVHYCQQDVVTTASVFLKLIRQDQFDDAAFIG